MTTCNKTLKLLASKFGLEDEEKVLCKAAEFERLLQTKTIAGSNITDTSKAVICLDLAANALGADLDTKTAIKFSGLKASAYANSRKIVENLLELNGENLTTNMLCLSFQCREAQSSADQILQDYRKQAKVEIDMNLPHYVCMAVYQACRINKIKVSKSKFVEKSRLKPSQWSKLDAEWSKFVDVNFAPAKKKKGRLVKDIIEDAEHVMELDQPKIEDVSEPQIESYNSWKKRVLETAYRELSDLQEKETQNQYFKDITPRRSPRKTPQKFTPYASPGKSKGVRNLFMSD